MGRNQRFWLGIGSGSILVGVITVSLAVLLVLGQWIGWDATWRTFGVIPLHPYFFDMHAVTDHAACWAKGFNPYELNSCDPSTQFNYPPIWLWLGRLGIDGSDSIWLSIVMTSAALAVLVALLRGRSVTDGLIASTALISPSMMMAIERGNIDLSIFALVGTAALLMANNRPIRLAVATAVIGLAVMLKLYPVFCAVSFARFNRRTFIWTAGVVLFSAIYFLIILEYLPVIRNNTPSIPLVSYGYKVIFLSLDQSLEGAHLASFGIANKWLPIALLIATVAFSTAVATFLVVRGHFGCVIADNAAGTAFLFGAGIYCGTFMLGANFTYRLIFLMLCLPQLLDWQSRNETIQLTERAGRLLTIAMLLMLWLNPNPAFLVGPQIVDWLVFFWLATIVELNCFMTLSRPLLGLNHPI